MPKSTISGVAYGKLVLPVRTIVVCGYELKWGMSAGPDREQAVNLFHAWRKHWPFRRGAFLPFSVYRALHAFGAPDLWMSVDSGVRLRLNPHRWIDSQILLDGCYEPDTLEILETWLRPGDAFVDVGSNIGYFTLLAARRVGPAGQVVAFDASPEMCRAFRTNVTRNRFPWVRLVEGACGAEDAGAVGFVEADGSSHVAVGGQAAMMVRRVTVDAHTVSLRRIRLVKMDIEGAEARALRGMARTLSKTERVIMEIDKELLQRYDNSPPQVLSIMNEAGFEARQINDRYYDFHRVPPTQELD